MKIKLVIGVLLITLLIGVLGCRKKNTDLPRGLSAKINGVPWDAITTDVAFGGYGPGYKYGFFIHSTRDSMRTGFPALDIDYSGFQYKVGTYSDNVLGVFADYDSSNNFISHRSYTATLTVTKYSTTNVQGTFSFSAYDLSVTDGEFNLDIK